MSEQPYYTQDGSNGAGSPGASPSNALPTSALPAGVPVEQTNDEVITASKLNEILEVYDRKIQSRQDKMASSLDKRVGLAQKEAQAAIDLLKGSGSNVTLEQEAGIRQTAVNRAIANSEADPQSQQGQQSQGNNPISAYVNSTLESMMIESKVFISPAEAKILIPNINQMAPHEVINAFKAIIDERVANTKPSPGSRLPFTQGTSIPGNDALRIQYETEVKNMSKHGNRGDMMASIKAKYQLKGLDVT